VVAVVATAVVARGLRVTAISIGRVQRVLLAARNAPWSRHWMC